MTSSHKDFNLGTPGAGIAGFVFGAFLGLITGLAVMFWISLPLWGWVALPSVFGLFGYLYGDVFHEWALRLIRWI